LTVPARGGCENWRSGRKNARGAGQTKESTQEIVTANPHSNCRLLASTTICLDHKLISSTTSKRQSGAAFALITITGTSDHHHLEWVITIAWND
jgi:hypothetical protein